MKKLVKFHTQVPESVSDRFSEVEHGMKQYACTAGLILYFNTDEQTQRLYREWARAIAEGYASLEKPPDSVAALLKQRSAGTSKKKSK